MSNETQLTKQQRLDDYAMAVSNGYEPPADILEAIATLIDQDVLSPDDEAALEALVQEILDEIAPIITSDGGGDTASLSFEENSVQAVTIVTAEDRYSLNDATESLTYSIVGGADASLFSIDNSTGELVFLAPPDFEATSGPLEVIVQVSDGGTLIDAQTLLVTVTDVNEAPTDIALDSLSIDENLAGGVVGNLTVVDPDNPAQPYGQHAFSVDDARFEVVAGQLKLKDGQSLDHESEPSVTVTVTATDGGGLSYARSFTIGVADVNEAPTAAADTATALEGGAPVPIDVLANDDDPDSDDNAGTLRVISAVAASGALVTFSGAAGAGISYDPSSTGAFEHLAGGQTAVDTVTYTIADSHGATAVADVTVTVAGVNDEPAITTAAGKYTGSGQLIGSDHSLAVALGDLDGDGDLDLVVGNTDPNAVNLVGSAVNRI